MARQEKAQYFKISEYTNANGTTSWRVAGYMPDGTRIRQNFKEKAKALRTVGDLELEVEGKPDPRKAMRTLFSPEELADAEVAAQQIKGQSLAKLVGHYLNLQDRVREKGCELNEAVAFFETRYRKESTAITILNAKADFLSSRHEIAAATLANYEIGVGLLLKPDPNKLVHAFTIADLEKLLKNYKKTASQRTFRTIFSTFFSWAVRHHYCLENPCKRFDKLPKDMSQIAALSLEESKRLLYAATQLQDGAAVACVAIGIFAGLRPSEIRDLKPEDVFKDKIRVSGGKLRRMSNRSVPISPVLAEWLQKYPFQGLPTGWVYKMKAIKKATKAKKWVQDIIRHTSLSFQAERDKDEAKTAFHNGTSIQMMNRHYRHTIDDEKTVSEFWSLTPAKLLAKPPKVDLEIKRRVEWPDKKALAKLVWQKPLVHAARDIGVSDVALKKHCVKVGIELPKQGHWVKG